jgi:putative ABC transport system permease protein
MLKNYFTLAIRNLLKRKVYSLINIIGLALGVAVCMIILRYVEFQLSYDSFHANADRIYRTYTTNFANGENRGSQWITGFAEGPSLLADMPEIKAYVRTHPMYGGVVISNTNDNRDVRFHEDNIQFTDSTYLEVFTHQPVQGNLGTALDQPSSVVLTRSMAQKYFADASPADIVGKTLQFAGGWADGDYKITAIIEDVPENAHFQFGALLSMHNLLKNGQYQNDNGWGWHNFVNYVLLHDGASIEELNKKMPAFVEKYRGKELAESNSKSILSFQPLKSIQLGKDFGNEKSTAETTIYFFLLISVFILSIAWVNYINLSTARAMERAREVGIKKSIGVTRRELMMQFSFEAILVNFLSIVAAIGLAVALLPILNSIVDKHLTFDFTDPRLWLVLGILFIVGSLLSGGYPAFILSSFKPVSALKGNAEKSTAGLSLRKALVVFQFASSFILIAATFTIYRQLFFMQDQEKGFTTEKMLVINGPSVIVDQERSEEQLISLKTEIGRIAAVKSVATSGAIPGGGFNWGTGMRREGTPESESRGGSLTWVDPDFFETYGMTVIAGKLPNPDIASDMKSVLINEAAVKTFGLGDPDKAIGEKLILGGGDTTTVLGVLKNYHWNSLKSEHTPFLLAPGKIGRRYFSILLTGNDLQSSISQIEQKFNTIFPGNPFDYFFLDDFFDKQYRDDQQFGKIFSLFAVLAIVIACLGLWGLAAFSTKLKLREIGIRKVLGASVSGILSLLSTQYVKLLLVATLLAVPLTWYGIQLWLSEFAFKIPITADLFIIPALLLFIVALGTVSIQILHGANINPAKILRSE